MNTLSTAKRTLIILSENDRAIEAQIRGLLESAGLSRDFEILRSVPKEPVGRPILILSGLANHSLRDVESAIATASEVVIDLERVDSVRFAESAREKLRWFSTRDPRKLLGPLVDLFEGTYFDLADQTLYHSGAIELVEFRCRPGSEEDVRPLVAAVEIGSRVGIAPATIEKWLDSSPSANQSNFLYRASAPSTATNDRSFA